jgi:hypothetical protein
MRIFNKKYIVSYLFLVAQFTVFGGTNGFENIPTVPGIGEFKIAVSEFAHGVVVSRKSHEYCRGTTVPGLEFRRSKVKIVNKHIYKI